MKYLNEVLFVFLRVSNMDCYIMRESDDSVVPNEQQHCGLDAIPPSTNDWSHWGAGGFESNGLPRKYHLNSSAKENLTNLKSPDTRMSPVEGISMVPRVHLVQKWGSSIASENFLMNDRRIRGDDLFHDLIDFEVQDSSSMHNMDDIFLNSLLDEDLMHLENWYESSDTADPMHLRGNLRMAVLEDLETDDSTREDADANFWASQPVEHSTITESSGAAVEGEALCMEAAVLQELENVMLQLNSRTRICIRDALYRLASRSKEEEARVVANVMDRTSRTDIYCGYSRREAAESIEPKTNVIDRAIATLMFDRPGNAAAPGS